MDSQSESKPKQEEVSKVIRSLAQHIRYAKDAQKKLAEAVEELEAEDLITHNALAIAQATLQTCKVRVSKALETLAVYEGLAELTEDSSDKYTKPVNGLVSDFENFEIRVTSCVTLFTESLSKTNNPRAKQTTLAAKKMDALMLASPKGMKYSVFRDWKILFLGYMAVTKLSKEEETTAAQAVIRAAFHEDWTKMWTEGVIDISSKDNINQIIKLELYVQSKRHVLIDRMAFQKRNQQSGESPKVTTQP